MLSNEARVVQSLFYIQNKEGVKVPFTFNRAQRFLDEEESNRMIIAKARQKGFSSGIKAKFAVRVLGREGIHAVIMSHDAPSTQRHLDQVQYLFRHMKGPKPVFGRNSRNELYFPKTESTFYIGTAGARAFGRGDWITDLHCSEYAYWEKAERHHAGIFQAVPITGRIVIESTGNGRKNDFYYIWKHADSMGYKRLFYPWYADDEYSLKVLSWKPDTPKHNAYLLELKHKHNLTDGQMAWYEMKLRELREDLKLMQQEYPSEPEECFQATGGSLFNVEESFSTNWKLERVLGHFAYRLVDHPRVGYDYVIGCDPSGGTGNDDTAIIIFCCQTGEQVLELFNPHIDPLECAQILVKLGEWYNKAYIIPEGNNHGIATCSWLKENYDRSRVYKNKLGTATTPPKYGWINTKLAKHQLVGFMLEEIPQTTFYGKQTVDELNSFEETEDGKLEGRSDNCVIAAGLGMMGLKRFSYLRGTDKPPLPVVKEKPNYMVYTFEEVYESILKKWKGGGFYGPQVGLGYPYA